MIQNKERIKVFIYGFILLIIFGISSYRGISEYIGLKKYGRYTIGITTKKETTPKGGIDFDYTFTIMGKKYEGFDAYNPKIQVPGGRYYVIFSSKNPEQNEMLINQPVHDSIREVPPEGWREIPK